MRNDDAIARALARTGVFAVVSTEECDTRYALGTCGLRPSIAECFTAGKIPNPTEMRYFCGSANLSGMPGASGTDSRKVDPLRVLEGRFVVAFVALTLLCELKRRMAAPESVDPKNVYRTTLADECRHEAVLARLSPVRVIREEDDWRFTGVTPEEIDLVKRLGLPDLFDAVPEVCKGAADGA